MNTSTINDSVKLAPSTSYIKKLGLYTLLIPTLILSTTACNNTTPQTRIENMRPDPIEKQDGVDPYAFNGKINDKVTIKSKLETSIEDYTTRSLDVTLGKVNEKFRLDKHRKHIYSKEYLRVRSYINNYYNQEGRRITEAIDARGLSPYVQEVLLAKAWKYLDAIRAEKDEKALKATNNLNLQ